MRIADRPKLAPPPSEFVTPATAMAGAFDRPGAFDEKFGAGLTAVFNIEFGIGLREAVFRRQAGIFVFGCKPRHGDSPFRQFADRTHGQIRRRNEGNAFADKNAKAEVEGFGALDVFQLSEAIGDA